MVPWHTLLPCLLNDHIYLKEDLTMTNDALGDRMKQIEAQETARRFLPSLLVYARIDGRGFSKFTKGMSRPYDQRMSAAMTSTTKILVEETHATIGFVQSDEISLVWTPNDGAHAWFDGKIMKMCSVLAGLTTAAFARSIMQEFGEEHGMLLLHKLPHFDARVINMPSQMEAANMLLWRNLDATKNAISMAASHHYGHKELQGKSGADKQEMLWQKGQNFNSYPYFFKRGTWVRREAEQRSLTEKELARIPEKHQPRVGELVTRNKVVHFDLPPLSKIRNRVEVLFGAAKPITFDQNIG
jgi:tRNA(His) guanylyltransferase